jgi:hypothetical protein
MLSSIVRRVATQEPAKTGEQLRAAARQLDRADLYLAAAAHMDLDDPAAIRAITELRAEIRSVRKSLTEKSIRLSA